MDLPQPLQPGVVDQLLLGDFSLGHPTGEVKGNIPMDRVVAQAFAVQVSHNLPLCRAGGESGRQGA